VDPKNKSQREKGIRRSEVYHDWAIERQKTEGRGGEKKRNDKRTRQRSERGGKSLTKRQVGGDRPVHYSRETNGKGTMLTSTQGSDKKRKKKRSEGRGLAGQEALNAWGPIGDRHTTQFTIRRQPGRLK